MLKMKYYIVCILIFGQVVFIFLNGYSTTLKGCHKCFREMVGGEEENGLVCYGFPFSRKMNIKENRIIPSVTGDWISNRSRTLKLKYLKNYISQFFLWHNFHTGTSIWYKNKMMILMASCILSNIDGTNHW